MTAILKVDEIQDTSGNLIIKEDSNTITVGASGDTIALAGSTVTGITQGITEADQWRITADASGVADLTANWERVDTDGGGYFGTGMSQSSGIFTFPSTGYWLIMFNANTYTTGASTGFMRGSILTTLDNGSDGYSRAANGYVSAYTTGAYSNLSCNFIFDVTDTSNRKVKFGLTQNSSGTPVFQGDSIENYTYATFLRLGDT